MQACIDNPDDTTSFSTEDLGNGQIGKIEGQFCRKTFGLR
jgi:hypothetical protein